MTFVVTFQLRGKNDAQKRRVSTMKIDGQRALILYDKDRKIIEDLALAEVSDLSIEAFPSRAARNAP